MKNNFIQALTGGNLVSEAEYQKNAIQHYPHFLIAKNKLYKRIIFILVIFFLLFLSSGVAKAQTNCKQWNGEHQQLKYIVLDNKIFGQCGSCGELIPIRSDYGEEAQMLNYDSVYVKQLEETVIFLYEQLSEACHYGYAYELTFNELTESHKHNFEKINDARTNWLFNNTYLYERCKFNNGLGEIK